MRWCCSEGWCALLRYLLCIASTTATEKYKKAPPPPAFLHHQKKSRPTPTPKKNQPCPQINILLTSFPGLGLPPTLSMPPPDSSTVDVLARELPADLPASLAATRVTLTTTSNKHLPLCSDALLSSFSIAASPESNRLPLRLSAPLVGGGGEGFS